MIETRSTEVQLRWRPSSLTLAILTCAVVGLAVAVIGSLWQLVAFVAPLIGVLCSIVWQRPVPGVEVHADPGTHRCFETEDARVTVWATEAGFDSGALDLTVSVIPGMRIENAESDSRGRQIVVVAADRWGRYPIQGRITVGARGGLLQGTGVVDAADVFVFPTAPPQSTEIPRTDLLDRLGTHLTRYIGPGVEYADVRRYVPGDHLRTVNWSVSARRGSLHVTERLTDRAADVVVLVDKYPQPAGPATEATGRTVRGAVQVVQSALRSGDRAGVVALGDRRPRWLGADIGRRQFYRVLDAVMAVDGGFETTPGTLAPRAAVPPGAIVIAFSTMLDTEFALALIDLRKRGHTVVAVDVLEGAPFENDVDRLAARMWSLQRSFMYRDMGTIGVDVVGVARGRHAGAGHAAGARSPASGAEAAMNRALSTAFGLVMVAAAAVQADDAALVAAGLAVLAVLAGNIFRPTATLAVLLAAAVLILNEAPAMLAALSGLCACLLPGAATYRRDHCTDSHWRRGIYGCGLAAVSLPMQLPWVPLVAPLAVVALVALATRPFWADRSAR